MGRPCLCQRRPGRSKPLHEKKRGLLPKGRERSAQRNDAQCSNVSDPRKATGESRAAKRPKQGRKPLRKRPSRIEQPTPTKNARQRSCFYGFRS